MDVLQPLEIRLIHRETIIIVDAVNLWRNWGITVGDTEVL